MSYVIEKDSGHLQLDKQVAFCELLNNNLPPNNKQITELFNGFDEEIRKKHPDITSGALNNAHGDWYEWLLAISAWNYHVEHPNSNIALLLPNVRTFDVATLYKKELYDLIKDLREKVKKNTSVHLISSNPDFVLIKSENIRDVEKFSSKIKNVSYNILDMINEAYKDFISQCDFYDIVGYLSVKTSLRPDRRLQLPHEGSLMKAIYIHLQTRQWIINPPGLKYFAITTHVNESDRKALKTVATHSIINVHDVPQAAVDEIFSVNSLSEAYKVFSKILC